MSPETAFQIVQLLPLPLWVVWIFFPRSRASRHLATAEWPWVVLAGAYLACFITAIASGGKIGPDSFTSLSGMMGLFASPWGALTGWVHYLCFDTFVARWMMNQAPDAGYRLAPILFATMMFGPIGLLAFRVARPLLIRK
jgi:ABA4-like protein